MLLHRREEPTARGRGDVGLARRPWIRRRKGRSPAWAPGPWRPKSDGGRVATSHAVGAEGPRLAYFFTDEATGREEGVAAGALLIHNIGHGCRQPNPTLIRTGVGGRSSKAIPCALEVRRRRRVRWSANRWGEEPPLPRATKKPPPCR